MEAPPVVIKKRTFLSTLALGVSLFGATVVVCATMVVLYGMNIADRRTDGILAGAGDLLRGLPEARKALPPAIADIFDDRRVPDYARQIQVAGKIVRRRLEDRWPSVAIEVKNDGGEMVTLLSLRVVLLDADDHPVAEWNEWAATPLAIDDEDWRGPILPGSTRRLVTHPGGRLRSLPADAQHVGVEVSDIRVWRAARPVLAERVADDAPGAPAR